MNPPQVYMCSQSWTLLPPPSPIPSLWVVPVHQPQASSIVHRTWTGDSFYIWYYTCFNASSVYSCHLFLLSYSSVRSIPFLPFIEPIFAWNVPFVSLIFLKRSLVFPIQLFSSISLHWSVRKAFLSLLAILWNSAFRWVFLSFSLLPFTSLLS